MQRAAFIVLSGSPLMAHQEAPPEPAARAPQSELFQELTSHAEIKARLEELQRVLARKRRTCARAAPGPAAAGAPPGRPR